MTVIKGNGADVFAQLTDSTDQKPTVTTPVAILFNTNEEIEEITHSTSSAQEDIIIDSDGVYVFEADPQIERTSGAGFIAFHIWPRVGTDDKGGVSSVSVANPSVITTGADHNMITGQTAELSDLVTTPDINAQHIITVLSPTTFSIPVDVTVVTDGVGNFRRVLDINDDVANSNAEKVLGAGVAVASDVLPLALTKRYFKGEKINIMQSIDTTGEGAGLVASTPAGESKIPSIMFEIHKI